MPVRFVPAKSIVEIGRSMGLHVWNGLPSEWATRGMPGGELLPRRSARRTKRRPPGRGNPPRFLFDSVAATAAFRSIRPAEDEFTDEQGTWVWIDAAMKTSEVKGSGISETQLRIDVESLPAIGSVPPLRVMHVRRDDGPPWMTRRTYLRKDAVADTLGARAALAVVEEDADWMEEEAIWSHYRFGHRFLETYSGESGIVHEKIGRKVAVKKVDRLIRDGEGWRSRRARRQGRKGSRLTRVCSVRRWYKPDVDELWEKLEEQERVEASALPRPDPKRITAKRASDTTARRVRDKKVDAAYHTVHIGEHDYISITLAVKLTGLNSQTFYHDANKPCPRIDGAVLEVGNQHEKRGRAGG